MIELDQVTMRYPVPKRYREHLLHPFQKPRSVMAIEGVALRIKAADRPALLGPNGAGKTTLLKLIGGLLYPTAGQITIDGLDTVRHNLHARRRVGYVINEERSFYWRLTATQNLEFFGTLDDLPRPKLRDRITELLCLVGLEHAAHKRVSDYSSGMKQRLAIARGLLSDPDVLLLDEPTRSLDPLGAQDIRNLLTRELRAESARTLVATTNQIADVPELCDQLYIIVNGRIVASRRVGDADEREISDFYRDSVER